MIRRPIPVKTICLVAPLVVLILSLHAWGEGLRGWVQSSISRSQYPEHVHGPFRIRVPRGSATHQFAAKTLDEFVRQTLEAHGRSMGLRPPSSPVPVYLLKSDRDLRRFGFTQGEELNESGGIFDPERGIAIRIDEKEFQQDAAGRSLRHQMVHALLHDSGRTGRTPWLAEGLAGQLEGGTRAEPALTPGELPSLLELITAREIEFRGDKGRRYSRGTRLLVTFLQEREQEGFFNYYRAAQEQGPLLPTAFAERIGDPARVEALWKEWLRARP